MLRKQLGPAVGVYLQVVAGDFLRQLDCGICVHHDCTGPDCVAIVVNRRGLEAVELTAVEAVQVFDGHHRLLLLMVRISAIVVV